MFTSAGNHRFGFGGMEKDDDWKGEGNSLDFGARIYDPRIGKWLSRDPLAHIYPEYSQYAFTANSPIQYREVDGRGFNAGFKIVNKSSETIIVVGNSKTIIKDANGKETEMPPSPNNRVSIPPGHRLEVYVKKTNKSDGSVEEKYTARLVDTKDKIVNDDVGAWDVDFIDIRGTGQTFIDEGIISDVKYNLDVNDKNAKSPNPGTGFGTIKTMSSVFDLVP